MEVGLVVGGKAASTVISKLINGIIDYAKDQKKMQLGLKDELKRLEKALPKIQAVVNAVDQGLIKEKNPALATWLWQLRDAADQADDVMDEMEYNFVKEKVEAGKDKVNKVVSNLKTFLKRAVYKDPFLKRLIVAVKAIDGVASGVGEFYSLVQDLAKNQKEMVKSAISSRETSSVLNVGNHVFGREKEKEIVIEKLLNPETKANEMNFAVLPIIGAGGVGKTTLAQLVYDDAVVKENFELRMWVCISNNFDVDLLTKKLYESAIGQRADADYFASIQTKIEEKLMSKKFLIVFDDAWNDKDRMGWETLVAPLKCGKSGSMILLTTRMETVARLIGPNVTDSMILKGLNEGDMRGLLEEYAFGSKDPNNYKELVHIGSKIVKKLKGIPLAAKTVGGLLCSNLSETHWTRILESELWSLKQEGPNEIMPALRLTYQHLPSHLKPCFSFCSIFPQDHIFIKDDLINMWVALGLVPRDFNGAKRPEDIGSEYFEDMLNRAIFSPANPVRNSYLQYPAYTYYNVKEKQSVGGYIMHDLMHDLSLFVSQGECARSYIDDVASIPTTVRHLYIQIGAHSELHNFNWENIRTLILQFEDSDHPKLDFIVDEIIKKSKRLRVLGVFALKLSKFPKSASDLLHLRYLSLSSFDIKEFPISMSKLYFLETMVCGGFGIEKSSQAAGIVELINMRHLIVSEDFVETIAGLGRLTSLQELSCHMGKNNGFKICDLRDMIDLRRLSISNVGGIARYEEVFQANLQNKVNLSTLNLQWEADDFDEEVFKHLEPHSNLKELKIRNYVGRLPPWLTSNLFLKLEMLTFESVRTKEKWSQTELPYNWMQCLRELTIDDCPSLSDLPPLPASLKKLRLSNLGVTDLQSLWKNPSSQSRSLQAFVGLKELIISNCRNLTMTYGCFRDWISLERLDIRDCPRINLSMPISLPFLPSTLKFLRIDSDVTNIQAKIKNEDEAKLFVVDHLWESSTSDLKLIFPDVRNYTGMWPPVWLRHTISMLESLCVDGQPSLNIYHSNDLPNMLLQIINKGSNARDRYPYLEINPSDSTVLEKSYLVTQNNKLTQCLKKLTVALYSSSCVMPPLSFTLKELKLHHLGLVVLPYLYENKSSDSGSLPSLVSMKISHCPNLRSLAEGLFQKPQQFAALEKLKISDCRMLRELPQGGFNKFVSLKELDIGNCPNIDGQLVPECFLPSALQVLCVSHCGDLDATLTKALESVQSLISLELYDCRNIRSLPPKEVFRRWKTLEKLEFIYCHELTSLESLLGLSSMRLLIIRYCPNLVSAITSPLAGKKDEIEGMVEEGTIQTSNRPASTQPKSTDKSSLTNTEHKPLLSVDELNIDNPQLLYIEPIRSLSSVKKLTIEDCSEMQSLPELPPIREELLLEWCSPELKRRCEESAEDWPKLSHIPNVVINGDEHEDEDEDIFMECYTDSV